MEYWIEEKAAGVADWHVLGCERNCSAEWAEQVADSYRKICQGAEIRVRPEPGQARFLDRSEN